MRRHLYERITKRFEQHLDKLIKRIADGSRLLKEHEDVAVAAVDADRIQAAMQAWRASRKKKRMTVKEANEKAMKLARKMRKGFFALSERQQADEIGCSWATWNKTPFFAEAQRKRPPGKPKKPSSPKTESLTTEREAVTGEGDRDEVLRQLAAEQAADREPSPLDGDPPNRSRKIHSRKRL